MSNKHAEGLELEGLVTHRAGDRIVVETASGQFSCKTAKKNRYHQLTYGGVLVGDRVWVKVGDNSGVEPDLNLRKAAIEKVYPRKNAFFRGNPQTLSEPQGIASNIDRIIVMGAVEDRTTPFGLIDRVLVAADCCEDVERILLWNKIDLLPTTRDFEQTEFYSIYRPLGYSVVGLSVKDVSQDDLHSMFSTGRSLLVGASGVGKSTLLNRLVPSLELATNPISKLSGKGVHTTSAAHLYRLANGAEVIDTPGFKAFIVNGVAPELEHHFPEFRPYLQKCQFADCRHYKDKGCAIREAVEQGKISQSRYDTYITLLTEVSHER